MFGFILFIVVCYILIKFKNQIRETWDNLKRTTHIKKSPSNLRDYHPMILLSEVVHYRVIDEFGIGADIIRNQWTEVSNLLTLDKMVRVSDLTHLYKEKAMANQSPTLVLFFEEINKNYNINDQFLIKDILLAIEYGLEK